jgi:hypothetical protein
MEDDIGTPVEPDVEEEEVEVQAEPEPELYDPQRCLGVKANGEQCFAYAKKGYTFCAKHMPRVEAPVPVGPPEPPKVNGLKPFPFHDGGVNENAAIRVIRMVQPQCPVDALPEIKNRDGSYSPNPNFTGQQNCQQIYKKNNQGVWDVEKCESLGHDPWHTTFRRPILKEVLDENGYVIETKTQYQVESRLNVIQVSLNRRHSSGMEVALAQAKGCKFMEAFGYASPCEFRNCCNPQKIETRFGNYCSERHARLIAADDRKMMLPVGGDPYTETQAFDEREQMLESINIRKGG